MVSSLYCLTGVSHIGTKCTVRQPPPPGNLQRQKKLFEKLITMPLKLTLKPQEKVIIGGAVVKNGASTSHFTIENNVPVLRQADILTEAEATTPCRRIYLALQLMYIDGENRAATLPIFSALVHELLEAVPSMKELISKTNQYTLNKEYYQALKQAKKLIAYEEELLINVSKSC